MQERERERQRDRETERKRERRLIYKEREREKANMINEAVSFEEPYIMKFQPLSNSCIFPSLSLSKINRGRSFSNPIIRAKRL